MVFRIGDMKKLLRYCGLVVLGGAALYLPSCDDDGPGDRSAILSIFKGFGGK